MPTPNQTTPDEPERVRGAKALAEHLLGKILNYDLSLHIVQEEELAEFTAAIEAHMQAETTRLAEALKEAEADSARLDWLTGPFGILYQRQNEGACITRYGIDSAMAPAPISGAKKE